MPSTVVVMLPAGEVSAPAARALVSACTAALREGECVIGGASTGADVIAVATVTLSADGRISIDVDVREKGSSPERHPSRDLAFHDADPIEERWRSTGFAIASLSGGAVSPAAEPPEKPRVVQPAPARPPKPRTKEVEARPHEPGPIRASARVETGPGLTRGTWRLGGSALGGYDFDDGFWGIDVFASYAANPGAVGGVDVSWLTFAGGASVAFTAFNVEGRLGALLGARDVVASASDPASGEQEVRARWLPIGIAHASLRWPGSTPLGVLSGVELRRSTGGTTVQSHGTYIGSSASLDFGLFLGVEVRP